ncbi:Actin-like protein arp9 [Xanthoria parietina]
MPPFKDEHILVIAPGSQTTLAQLGLPESFTPAQLRVSTRMFPAEKKGEWEPIKIRERKITKHKQDVAPDPIDGDTAMAGTDGQTNDADAADDEGGSYFEEDPTTEEGAVYPIREGRVVDWSCLFALMTHIYNTLSPPFHTPILIITQPAWTAQDHEIITQFFFEKFKTPAFCLMDSALAVCYAYGASTATVIDIGYEKCDITAVNDFLINDAGRGTALTGCGGESMTQRLLELLSTKGFARDMCEQLKRSGICEVLPSGTPMPGEAEAEEPNVNPAAAASAGANAAGLKGRGSVGDSTAALRVAASGTDAGDEAQDGEGEDNEGVLDVATIVASGKTSEFLARKEKEKAEKAEKAAAKKAAQEAANAPKPAKLPNAKRMTASFQYTERRPLEEINQNGKRPLQNGNENGEVTLKRPKTPEPQDLNETGASEPIPTSNAQTNGQQNGESTALIRRDVEVGVERFQAATGGILDQVADAVHRCILSVPEVGRRGDFWDNLIIVGNGSRVRGCKEALVAKLHSKYLISPSSATIFTSELPSNFTTPVATGANTPQPQSHMSNSHHGPGVNPLLAAAVTASNPGGLAPPSQHQHLAAQLQMQQYHQQHQHSGHGQTPTSIKLMKMPEYFPEWKDAGIEEAAFLGAQVAAKVVFVVDQGLSKGFMSRTEYNDLGPQGIHEFCM